MKKINKHNQSLIITEKLSYPKDRQEIAAILLEEQQSFCAYTEERIEGAYSVDIDHFNPTIKETSDDGYRNWFLISTGINRKKNAKWADFQPILEPTDQSLEERIEYNAGYYVIIKNGDLKAQNLIDIIDLNNSMLVEARQSYIEQIMWLELNLEEIKEYFQDNPKAIKYRRALESVFGFML